MTKSNVTNIRPISVIAQEITQDWKKVSPYALPYLGAMYFLDSIEDSYYLDSGRSVIAYFLSSARSWRGETARRVKKELNEMLKR